MSYCLVCHLMVAVCKNYAKWKLLTITYAFSAILFVHCCCKWQMMINIKKVTWSKLCYRLHDTNRHFAQLYSLAWYILYPLRKITTITEERWVGCETLLHVCLSCTAPRWPISAHQKERHNIHWIEAKKKQYFAGRIGRVNINTVINLHLMSPASKMTKMK